jgi:hypothetical protein
VFELTGDAQLDLRGNLTEIPAGSRIIVTASNFECRITWCPPADKRAFRRLSPGESARIVGNVGMDQRLCGCGHDRCAQRHWIGGWSPAIKLESFVASAIKGLSPSLNQVGKFLEGMLAAIMARESPRMRAAEVEFRRCHGEEVQDPRRCQPPAEYEGSRCPHCHSVATEGTERRTRTRLIMDGIDVPTHDLQERCRCPRCKAVDRERRNLFDVTRARLSAATRCDICGADLPDEFRVRQEYEKLATRLEKARFLVHQRRERQACRSGHPLPDLCWCPYCTELGKSASALPSLPTWVHVRTYAAAVPFEPGRLDVEDTTGEQSNAGEFDAE